MKQTKTNKKSECIGVTLSSDIRMLSEKPPVFRGGYIQMLLVALLAISSIAMGLSYTRLDYGFPIIAAFCLFNSYILCMPKKKYLALGMYVLYALVLYKTADAIKKGFGILITEFLGLYELSPSKLVVDLTSIRAGTSNETCITLALLTFAAVMLFILYVSVYVRSNFLLTFVVTFILPEVGLFYGLVPNYFWAFTLLSCWLAVFAMQLSDYQETKDTTGSFTGNRSKKKFHLTENKIKLSAFGQLSVQICLLTVIAISFSIIGATLADYKRSAELNIIRNHLGREFSIDSLMEAYKEINGKIDVPFGSSPIPEDNYAEKFGGLSLGQLSGNNSISYSGKTMLTVDYHKEVNYPIYLRGFAASRYDGTQWTTPENGEDIIDHLYYNYSIIVPSLYDYPAEYSTLLYPSQYIYKNQQQAGNFDIDTMTITDVTGNSGLLFMPYFTMRIDDTDSRIYYDDYIETLNSVQQIPFYVSTDISPTDIYAEHGAEFDSSHLVFSLFAEHFYTYQPTDDPFEHFCEFGLLKNPTYAKELLQFLCHLGSLADDEFERDPEDDGSITTIIPNGYRYEIGNDIEYTFDVCNPSNSITVFEDNEDYYSTIAGEITLEEFIGQVYNDILESDLLLSQIDMYYYSSDDALKYSSYVFNSDRYLEVNIDINDNIKQYIEANSDGFSTYSVIAALEDYFCDNYTYSLEVEATPEGEDFIEYFLNNMNAGSCTYYASAGAQILRYYGIPTRYVEGFAISRKEVNSASKKDGAYHIDVTDDMAHAWVEYYDIQYGWLPLEFTVSASNVPVVDGTTSTTTTTTTTTTTQPSVTVPGETTTTTTTTSQTSPDSSDVTAGKKSGSTMRYVVVSVAVLILLVAGYLISRYTTKKRLYNEVNTSDRNLNTLRLYTRILSLFELINISYDANITDSEHAKLLKQQLSEEQLEQLAEGIEGICELAVYAKMSNDVVSEEDTQKVRSYYDEVHSAAYEKMSKTKRFYAKYIKMLY
ncbi:MAG: transglutaminase domain-containing protein [Oscillospiraceae bacterium]|nr:transglutaminase domain-containing protein [Oscillospiraceae bacterium]